MAQYLTDFPPGPLDKYRKSASFDWKQLRIFLDTAEILEFEKRIHDEIQKYPEFIQQYPETPTLDEIRQISLKKMFLIKYKIEPLYIEAIFHPRKRLSLALTSYPLDASATMKHGLGFGMFFNVVQSMGTERHAGYVQQSLSGDIIGCFCLTEIAHGSNSKGIRTTATYDVKTKSFILHTPDFQAAKCWVGVLGQTATHAIIFAHLITPDGKGHGLHAFVVDIRDPKTMLPYPGITVCDMGEKLGLNGVDNGLIMFNYFHIPKENLLNKIGDVTDDGKYVTPYKDPNRRHGASLGALSDGRVGITAIGTSYLIKAITIAVRYAAVRRQFSANDLEEEIPILEYQSHQYRLLPYLATTYALKIFCTYLFTIHAEFLQLLFSDRGNKDLPDMGMEIHGISSASKPFCGWIIRDAIQECREACAGHGYLKAAGLGEIRNNHDPNCTYEGENHVLIQQTSNWLLKVWPTILKGQNVSTPFKSLDFLNNAHEILKWKFVKSPDEEIMNPTNILNAYQWLTCYLLKTTYEKYQNLLKHSPHPSKQDQMFWAKNDSQVFFAKTLSVVYVQHLILHQMYKTACEADNPQIRNVLLKLFSLFGVWSLEKHVLILYQGDYAAGPDIVVLIQNSILKLCADLKNDAVSLIDAIAQPDFVINSVLGYSDGQVYKHLEDAILNRPGALSTPKWWKDIAAFKENIKTKL